MAALTALLLAGCGGGGGGGGVQQPTDDGQTSAGGNGVATAWVSGEKLDRSQQAVKAFAADIDDSGRVMAVYTQTVGDRLALHAVLSEPGAAGGQPVFGSPTVIDAAAPHDGALGEFSVTVSPLGHALATWVQTAPCNADSYKISGDCRFVVASRRMVGQGWETPVRVGDTPAPLPNAIINDNGDVAMMWTAWRRAGDGVVAQANGVVEMQATATRFAAPWMFEDIQLPDNGYAGLALDRAGHVVYVTTGVVGGRKQLVARRGSFGSGFGPTERLDSIDADAVIESVSGGLGGHVVVLWQQASGGAVHRFAATIDSPGQAWQVADLGLAGAGQRVGSALGDGGDFLRYDLDACSVLQRKSGVWQAAKALPSGLCQTSTSFVAAVSRAGDVVGGLLSETQTAGNTGQWLAYSAQRQAMTHAFGQAATDHLLGTPSTLGGRLLLAENGVAALLSINAFDALPSAAAPAGTVGAAANLWLSYARLP